MSSKINKLNLTENNKDENNINNKKSILLISEKINNIINNVKTLLFNIIDDSIARTINSYFNEINDSLEILIKSFNSIIISKEQNEIIQRKDEQSIRVLYAQIFHEKLINEIHENKIYALSQKEKEYELLKQKTGAIICNGKIICNERKDNEIIILRTENSLLKSAIQKNEDLIKEKNDLIKTLHKDILFYKTQIDDFHKTKALEYSSFSNINININEAKNNYKKKKNNSINDNHYTNSIDNSSAKKKNKNILKNGKNNIYSSYQFNSQLINKLGNANINKIKKEDYSKNNKNIDKYLNKNNTIDSNCYSYKYISVNKSIFNQKNEVKMKETIDDNSHYFKKSRQAKKKIFFKTNMPLHEYNTISNEIPKRKEIKTKRHALNNQVLVNHRKANSIQYLDNSFKKINITSRGEKEKYFSNEKNIKNKSLLSVLKKISDIKNLKKNYESSYITVDSFKKNNNMIPHIEKKNTKGRNEKFQNNSKIGNDSSSNFFSKTTYNYFQN